MIDKKKQVYGSYPEYGVVRMCEGKSLMLTPADVLDMDMDLVEEMHPLLSRFENDFVKIDWRGVPVTIYSNGSMLFYHLTDKDIAERYAIEILISLGLVKEDCSQKITKVGIENVE